MEILLGNVLMEQEIRQKGKVSALRQAESSSPFLHIYVDNTHTKRKQKGELGKILSHMCWFPPVLVRLPEGDPTALRPKARDQLRFCSEERGREPLPPVNEVIPIMNFIGLI